MELSAPPSFYDKVRQNPPQFGVMRVGVSRDRNPEVEELSHRLLSDTGLTGVCTVEFRRDSRDNRLKLMEVNVRMPRMNWLATVCGRNFPWIAYADIVERTPADAAQYTSGLYWIELWADVWNSIVHHRQEMLSLREYLEPYSADRRTFAVWHARDPVPFLKQTFTLPVRYWRMALTRARSRTRHAS